MSATGDRMRELLSEAKTIAAEQFDAQTLANVPLLVTHIALIMTQIEEGAHAPHAATIGHTGKDA
jgi:hypothetical protein